MEIPIALPIAKIIDEAKDIKSFFFKHSLNAKPGQFINLWIPGLDEKPYSISHQSEKDFAVTIRKIGNFTKKLFELKKGTILGIRGPYGSGYKLEGKNILLAGGGCGCGPLAFLADEAAKKKIKVTFIIGANSKDQLLFVSRMKKIARVIAATDDGSYGFKGLATSVLEDFLTNEKNKTDKIFSCGPEVMLKKVAAICEKNKIDCELSLERYMKCGFGICGQCCMDLTGWRVCTEGPVFNLEQIKRITEFGNYRRDATGKKIKI